MVNYDVFKVLSRLSEDEANQRCWARDVEVHQLVMRHVCLCWLKLEALSATHTQRVTYIEMTDWVKV